MSTLIPNSIADVIAIAESQGYNLVKNGRKVDVTYPNGAKVYSYTGSIVAVALRLGIINPCDHERITGTDKRHSYAQNVTKDDAIKAWKAYKGTRVDFLLKDFPEFQCFEAYIN